MVRAGYKQTELGEIPESWAAWPLGCVCKKITDGTHDTPRPVKEGVPFLTAIHVRPNNIDFDNCYYLPMEIHREIFSRCDPQKNDVLMVNIGAGTATTALVKVDYEFSLKNVALLKPDTTKIVGGYLNQALLYGKDRVQRTFLSGGAQPFLSLGQISRICLPVPRNINEQKSIAAALADVDELIGSLEKLIAKKRDIETATMQQLLTGKRRLPGFGAGKGTKQTELGEIPEDWDVRTYGNTFSFLSTANNSRSDLSEEGEISYIHYGDIHTKLHFCLDLEKQNLPKIDRDKFKNPAFLEDGDVVMADASEDYDGICKSIEICNVGKKRVIAGLHTFLLRDTEKRYADGFRAYLHAIPAVKRAFDTLATGLKVYGLSKASLRDVGIPVPPFEEQEEIVKVLTGMSADLELAEKRLTKTKAIKQGMMQELLTGRTRLV